MNRSGLCWIIHKWVVCSVWHYPWACAASRGKCISLPWKTSVEQMLSVLSLSTKLWYKASNWLQQGLLPHWLISSCVELCHILAALQRILWVFSSWVCSNLLIVSMLSGVCHPNFFRYLVKSSCHPWLGDMNFIPHMFFQQHQDAAFPHDWPATAPQCHDALQSHFWGVSSAQSVSLPSLHLFSDPMQWREGQL